MPQDLLQEDSGVVHFLIMAAGLLVLLACIFTVVLVDPNISDDPLVKTIIAATITLIIVVFIGARATGRL